MVHLFNAVKRGIALRLEHLNAAHIAFLVMPAFDR